MSPEVSAPRLLEKQRSLQFLSEWSILGGSLATTNDNFKFRTDVLSNKLLLHRSIRPSRNEIRQHALQLFEHGRA